MFRGERRMGDSKRSGTNILPVANTVKNLLQVRITLGIPQLSKVETVRTTLKYATAQPLPFQNGLEYLLHVLCIVEMDQGIIISS